jgi:hypothetical protein
MENKELKKIIRQAALNNDINGVMELTKSCDLSYERVSRVWGGSTTAKLSDVAHVADKLGLKLKFVSKGE